MASGKTLDLTIRIAGKMDKSLTAALNGTQNRVSTLAKNISHLGTAGLAAMGAMAVGTVKAINSCTDAATAFEKQMADVVKYVSGLADENGQISQKIAENGKTFVQNYDEMSRSIRDISKQVPMTAEDLTRLAAAAGQSGKSIEDLIQRDDQGNVKGFLLDVAKVGTALDITADQAGDWAAKWEVAMNINHEQVMDLFDQINWLGANSATTAAEIAEVVNAVAGVGDIAGFDPASTAAMADTMLAMGVDVGVASNSISRMLINMSKGASATKAQKNAWKELGFTAEDIAQRMQAVDEAGNRMAPKVLAEVLERISKTDKSRQAAILNTLFGQWAIKGAAKMTGNLEAYAWALDHVGEASRDTWEGSMQREFDIKNATSAALDTRMTSALTDFKIEIGNAFLPAKREVAQAVIDFLGQIQSMPELGEVSQMLASMFSQGIKDAGEALQKAMPTIKNALQYLADHGPEILDTLKKLTVAFAAMKFAPAVTGIAQTAGGIAGNLLLGTNTTRRPGQQRGGLLGFLGSAASFGSGMVNRWMPNAAGTVGGLAQNFAGQVQQVGLRASVTHALGQGAAAVGNTGVGQYFGNLGASMANFGNRSGITGFARTSGQVLGNIFGFNGPYHLGGSQYAQPLMNVPGIWQGMKNAGAGAANWVAGKAGAVANSKPVQAIAGGVGKVVNSAPVQGIMSMGKGALSWAGGTLTSGLQVAGTALSPLVSVLGTIVSSAAPVVLAISGIIAVLSLLWGNVDALREPIGAIFGEKGLAIFDKFKGGLEGVFGFIQGLFDGGLADAVSPLRDAFGGLLKGGGLLSTIFGGEEGGLAAFDGLVKILQSVLGFAGQVVSFANDSVKPALVTVFGYVTETILPTIISMFSQAAPTIASILTSVGNIIMSVVQGIMTLLQALWPSIQGIIEAVLNIANAVIPVLLQAIDVVLPVIQGILDVIIPVITVAVSEVGGLLSGLATSIAEIVAGIAETFQGIIDFITGVFTGNWEQAWNGVKEIFGGVWDSLVALLKTPVNAIIGIINGAISGINSLNIDIPDWVPVIGGKKFGLNIPQMKMLAKGGFTNGPSIAGEAGREAVISFDRGVRSQNIATWLKAGDMLGLNKAQTLRDFPEGGRPGSGGVNITFAPQITIEGNADKDTVDKALMESEQRFKAWVMENFGRLSEQYEREQARTAYAL